MSYVKMKISKVNSRKFFVFLIFGLFILSSSFNVNGVKYTQPPNEEITEEGDLSEVIIQSEDNLDLEILENNGESNVLGDTPSINYYGENADVPVTEDISAIEWAPIESSYDFTNPKYTSPDTGGSVSTASYNTITGIATSTLPEFLPQPELDDNDDVWESTEAFAGIWDGSIKPETIYGATDDRSLISTQTNYPYRTIVKLFIHAPDGSNFTIRSND